MTKKIVVLGDFNPIFPAQHSLNDSIRNITKPSDKEIQFDWISTDNF